MADLASKLHSPVVPVESLRHVLSLSSVLPILNTISVVMAVSLLVLLLRAGLIRLRDRTASPLDHHDRDLATAMTEAEEKLSDWRYDLIPRHDLSRLRSSLTDSACSKAMRHQIAGLLDRHALQESIQVLSQAEKALLGPDPLQAMSQVNMLSVLQSIQGRDALADFLSPRIMAIQKRYATLVHADNVARRARSTCQLPKQTFHQGGGEPGRR
jgi:hypothetical protein